MGQFNVIMGPCNLKIRPWNVIRGSRNVIKGLLNGIMVPRNVNREPWNVVSGYVM